MNLQQYIFENLFADGVDTTSNAQRKRELYNWLKHKNYTDYVETLNKMLKDPKAAALLADGFGGELGDTKLKFSICELQADVLMPTQNEIDLNKSLKHALTKRESFERTFDSPIVISHPIVTFNKKYIIDGHHAWVQAAVLNPKGKLLTFNYDGSLTPEEMLKVVQATIAAVKAQRGTGQELPISTGGAANFYEMSENTISNYIQHTLTDELLDCYVDKIRECYDMYTTVLWLTNRLVTIRDNNSPKGNAPEREYMPQLYKGGADSSDKESALPNVKGSAMNKLRDKKFVKKAVQR